MIVLSHKLSKTILKNLSHNKNIEICIFEIGMKKRYGYYLFIFL